METSNEVKGATQKCSKPMIGPIPSSIPHRNSIPTLTTNASWLTGQLILLFVALVYCVFGYLKQSNNDRCSHSLLDLDDCLATGIPQGLRSNLHSLAFRLPFKDESILVCPDHRNRKKKVLIFYTFLFLFGFISKYVGLRQSTVTVTRAFYQTIILFSHFLFCPAVSQLSDAPSSLSSLALSFWTRETRQRSFLLDHRVGLQTNPLETSLYSTLLEGL